MLQRIPRRFRNFYVIAGLSFFVWMLFLDSNDLISRFRMTAKLRSLENEKAYYVEKINEVQHDRDELLSNKELLEKFAREKYLMKKETEDIFVLEQE
ncbi:MAG TPA: septum formation initiator family protein [Cyclobacteriaceae bacterium]|nr:septum formation initiator family protein [Cyclobacteriaceae bacterium]